MINNNFIGLTSIYKRKRGNYTKLIKIVYILNEIILVNIIIIKSVNIIKVVN